MVKTGQIKIMNEYPEKIELKFPNTLVKSSSKMILNGCRICFYLHYSIFDLLSEDPIDDQLFCDGF